MIEASLKINPWIRRVSLLYTAEVLMHAWSTHVQHLHTVERKASFRMETYEDAVFYKHNIPDVNCAMYR